MKSILLSATIFLVPASWAAAQDVQSPAAALSAADFAYQAVEAAYKRKPVDPVSTLYLTMGFYLDFPDHPRARSRMRNVLWLETMPGGENALSAAQKSAYRELLKQRFAAALALPKLPDATRSMLMSLNVEREVADQHNATVPELARLRAMIDELAAQYGKERGVAINLGTFELGYVELLEKVDPAAVEPHLKKLAAGADALTADAKTGQHDFAENRTALLARGLLNVRAAYRTPTEMKFTALDGRKVDLKKMRGKVVLIDFWSTDCAPCIAEFPNLKQVFGKYQGKGFEVVGISLDSQDERQKLLDMVKEKELSWPQHNDGKVWNNEFAAKYGINQLPSMFLLDKKGLLISTNARGEKLEPEVRRLLGFGS